MSVALFIVASAAMYLAFAVIVGKVCGSADRTRR